MCLGAKGCDIGDRLTRSIQRPLIMDSLGELIGFRVLSSEDCSCLWIADDRFYNGSCDEVTSFIQAWSGLVTEPATKAQVKLLVGF